MKTIISTLIFLSCLFTFAQDKPLSFKLTTSIGSDSNPLSVTDSDEESSIFYSIKPEALYETKLGNNFWFFGAAAFNFKDYNEDIVSNGARDFSQIYELGLSKVFNNSHEIGFALGYTNNKSRQLDFSGNSFNPDGRPLKYEVTNGVLSYTYLKDWGSVTLNYGQLFNDSTTLTNDEFGVEYGEAHKQEDISLKFSFNLSEETKLLVTPYYSQRDYEEQPARNTEGVTQATNPVLEELHRGIEAILSYEQPQSYKLTGGTIFIREKDLVFGAEDADVLGFNISSEILFYDKNNLKLNLIADFSFSTKEYSNFTTDPSNASIQDLREEDTTSLGLGLRLEANKNTELVLSYFSSKVDSNYKVAGSSYKQNIFSLNSILKF